MTKGIFSSFRAQCLTLCAASALLCGVGAPITPAAAQGYSSEENIIVQAPYYKEDLGVQPGSKMHTTLISVSRTVDFSDLDLRRNADINELALRVNDTARDACRELDKRFSPYVYVDAGGTDCVKTATENAMARVDRIIADKRG
jgi:UrcA family protein